MAKRGRAEHPQTAQHRSRSRLPLSRRWPETRCDCRKCQLACLHSPGWFLPAELPRLANYLDLPLAELFLCNLALSVTQIAGAGLSYGVMPHKLRHGKKPGSAWSLRELIEPGRCIFYHYGRCRIYPVRPFECSRAHHEFSGAKNDRLRADVAAAWSAAELAPYRSLVREGARRRPRA